MPPKAEITKEKVVETAFQIVREQGLDALTARNIAKKLNCSTQPIYSVFENMEEVKDNVYNMAVDFALSCMKQYKNDKNSPALNLATGYLYFAKNEKQLFRTVYLSGHKKYDLNKDKLIAQEMSTTYMRYSKRLNAIAESKLKKIFFRLSIYLVGIGAMINTDTLELDINEAVEMVKDMYEILLLSEGITRKTDQKDGGD